MKKNRMAGAKIRNCKRRGEWAELVFAMRAVERGLILGRPWGESSGYDFTVDQGARIVRVQVKSTIFREGKDGYSCTLKDSKGPYKKGSFEFVAAYVIPEECVVYFAGENDTRDVERGAASETGDGEVPSVSGGVAFVAGRGGEGD